MREDKGRVPERVELSLDGRQIASIVVAALVILAVVFVLGLNVGRQVARREAAVTRGPSLEDLDRPAAPAPPRVESFTYHEKLTSERPSVPPPPPKSPAAEAAAPAEAPKQAAIAEKPSVEEKPAPAADALPADRSGGGGFSVQIGATQDRAEADRLATKYKAYHPRVETADIGDKGRWYRVRVGAFGSRDEAKRYLADLTRETGVKGMVTSGP